MNAQHCTTSVVIPAYNAAALLPACLAALRRQTCSPDEIIVVDDGSTDGTADVARSFGVKVLTESNKGPASARNLGVAQTNGQIILFTDADCVPCPEWVEALCQPFHAADIVGVKGTYKTKQNALVARFVQQEYEYKYDRLAREQYIDFVDTYSAAYRRDVFEENGGFDEAFTTSHNPKPSNEDQELSFRLARKGYHIVFAPGAVVEHQHDVNLGEYVSRKYGIGYWKAFMLRYLPEKTFKDSHTPPSQRWQILLLGLTIVSIACGLIVTAAWLAALAWLVMFFISSLPMLAQIWRRDRPVMWIAPVLLICRAAALGAGLAFGFVLAPSNRHAGLTLWTRPVKRVMDVAGAIIGGMASIPVVLAAAIVIRLDSPGAVFFVQERAGENGRKFRMIKLRTMVDGAEKQISQLMDRNPIDGPAFKLPHDPRVTRAGRFLRRWSIDELPQFLNVLRGEMSLVGPRPEEPAFVDRYNEQQRRRLIVKPGLTGPAQVAGRGALNFDQRLELELNYIEHYSLRLDLEIIWRSIGAVITGKGAY